MWFLLGFVCGFLSCLLFLYLLGTSRHKGHPKAATGPSSKSHLEENVVAITKKG